MIDSAELKRLAAAIESCTSIHEEDEAAWMRRATGRAVVELLDEVQDLRSERDEFFESQGRRMDVLREEQRIQCDQLKAENEALKKTAGDVSVELYKAIGWICHEVEAGTKSATHWAIRLGSNAKALEAALTKDKGQ